MHAQTKRKTCDPKIYSALLKLVKCHCINGMPKQKERHVIYMACHYPIWHAQTKRKTCDLKNYPIYII